MPEAYWGEPLYTTLPWDETFRRYYLNEPIQADDPAADRWARDGHRSDHTQTLAPIEPDAVWILVDDERGGYLWEDALSGDLDRQAPGGA